jgi:putative PIG3 family NAD(P)H quinone oxidoreductase
MRAVTVREPGDPDVLQLSELPDPVAGPGEVIVSIAAAGVNRADLQQRIGVYAPPPGASPIIGLECSGEIAELGPDVDRWQVGDPCVALLAGGGYAEQVAVPAGQVLAPPDGIELITAGGLMEVSATVTSNLAAARLAAGETFLVHGGAGGIGTFAIQYARAVGATVIATAGSAEKVQHCRTVGADLAVSYRDDWPAAVADFTQGRGVDVILDNMGAKYLKANTGALAADGRLIVIGLQGGRRETLDLGALLAKRASISATSLRSRPIEQKSAICRQVAERVWPMFTDGTIKPAPETRLPLAEVVAAHTQLESGDNIGKILLLP